MGGREKKAAGKIRGVLLPTPQYPSKMPTLEKRNWSNPSIAIVPRLKLTLLPLRLTNPSTPTFRSPGFTMLVAEATILGRNELNKTNPETRLPPKKEPRAAAKVALVPEPARMIPLLTKLSALRVRPKLEG